MKVLVVDDNRTMAELIQEILEYEGHEVMSAYDGQDGYYIYLNFKPDIIITDIQMPLINGFEMMRLVRSHDPTIKTIYMSGNFDSYKPLLVEETKTYPVSYFEKPFSLKLLKKAVLAPAISAYPQTERRDYDCRPGRDA